MLLNKEQLEDALRCRELNCENCRMDKPNCVGGRCVEDVAETAIHYLTLSERQAKVLEMAKGALISSHDVLTALNGTVYRNTALEGENKRAITAIEELSDNGQKTTP